MRRLSAAVLVVLLAACGGGGSAPTAPARVDTSKVDADGDGYTPQSGDCNDADAAIKPGGGFDFAIDFALSGNVSCAQPNSRQQTYTVTNYSCSPLVIQKLEFTNVFTGTCVGAGTRTLGLATSTVPAASTTPGKAAIRRGAPAGTAWYLCCPTRVGCRAGNCNIDETYTVTTSAGSKTLTNHLKMFNSSGAECRACKDFVSPQSLPGAAEEGLPQACTSDPS